MKAIFAAAILAAVTLVPAAASAPERLKDGAIGAVAGVLVARPVGLVAAAAVGNTAAPDISRGVNPRYQRQHDDRHFDGSNNGHRSASR